MYKEEKELIEGMEGARRAGGKLPSDDFGEMI